MYRESLEGGLFKGVTSHNTYWVPVRRTVMLHIPRLLTWAKRLFNIAGLHQQAAQFLTEISVCFYFLQVVMISFMVTETV